MDLKKGMAFSYMFKFMETIMNDENRSNKSSGQLNLKFSILRNAVPSLYRNLEDIKHFHIDRKSQYISKQT